jgi:hypothetical protein
MDVSNQSINQCQEQKCLLYQHLNTDISTYFLEFLRTLAKNNSLGFVLKSKSLSFCQHFSGTIVSGFCILCCARPRVPPKYNQDFVLLLCTNTLVGLAQLFTVTFLLVGWFWSAAWGIRMVILSCE